MCKNKQQRKQRTRRGHYVAQLYLRGFTNTSGMMFCYDKAADQSHPTTTRAAAQEPYFYEIPDTSFSELNFPINTVENALSRLEAVWAPMLAELIKCADKDAITMRQLLEFSPFVVIQWMRTKTYRDWTLETFRKFGQSYVDELVKHNFPGQEGKAKFVVDPKEMSAVHAAQLFDQDRVQRMANDLDQHIWVVGINETESLFYTSDHPVVRRANRNIGGIPQVGVLDPGVEFAFPLDSRHILLILERSYFAEWKQYDNRPIRFTVEQVRDYNQLQVRKSCQRVFCAADDFGLARETCVSAPAIRDPNRPRMRIDATPIIDLKNEIIVSALE